MEIPANKPLLLLPGLLCDGSVWQHQARVLADWVTAHSVEWSSEDSLPAMAQTVLRNAPERFSLAGHSMGGRVALEVYRAAPERVERIALLNTGYKPLAAGQAGEDETRGRYALLEIACSQGMRAMAEQWLPPMIHPDRHADTQLVEAILDMFARKTPEMFAAQIKALLSRPDATGVLEQIDCPALVLTGREDGWSPPIRHSEIAGKIRGSKLVIVPDCGHMSHMERPEAVASALREWLVTD